MARGSSISPCGCVWAQALGGEAFEVRACEKHSREAAVQQAKNALLVAIGEAKRADQKRWEAAS